MIKKQGQFKKQYRKKQYSRNQYRTPMYRKPELKAVDGVLSQAVNSAGSIGLVPLPAAGTGPAARIGNNYNVKSVQFRSLIGVTPATGTDQRVRVMLFVAKHNAGVGVTITDLLQTIQVYSLRNWLYMSDYKVLLDRVFTLNAAAESGSSRIVNYYKKMNMLVHCQDAGATTSDTDRNTLFWYVIGSNPAGATAADAVTQFRVTFEDA